MDPRLLLWKRILVYREELIRVCDQVSLELHVNRNRREEWQKRNLLWKQHWMPELTSERHRRKLQG